MKALHKKILILSLSLSNLLVLGLVFHTYFNNSNQSFLMASRSENLDDLESKVQENCKEALEELVEGKRSSFICNVRVKQKQKEASYILKTRVKVTKNPEGEGFLFEGQGRMMEKRQHATEADFCNDCTRKTTVASNDPKDIINEVLNTAQEFYTQAQDSVREARREYNTRDKNIRLAKIKERRCEGKWDESEESFEEFDLEERLSCKMNKISGMLSPLEIEGFYHKELKNELWKTALSDEDYLLEDLLEEFNNPYRYSLSVRSSSSLLKNYGQWKDHFQVLDTFAEKEQFLRRVKSVVDQTIPLMTKNQSEKDLYYLNQGFDGLLVRLNQGTSRPQLTTPVLNSPPSTNYDEVRRQTDQL